MAPELTLTLSAPHLSPALGGGGDVVEHQLVGAAVAVVFGEAHGAGHIVESQKVDPLDHPAVLHVQAGDDALGNHCWGPPSRMASRRFTAPAYHALPTMAPYRSIWWRAAIS